MFSIGNTDPRPYKRTLASAGMSCVVVTNTFTQLLLWDTDTKAEQTVLDTVEVGEMYINGTKHE